ncbi:MAG: hypothetical protein WCD86_11435 [Ktedonobacteraceae bacterium]
MTVQPRLASTIMLLRDQSAAASGQGVEVFMVRRVIQSDFMPDVYVFPGGSISNSDRDAEQSDGLCRPISSGRADPEGRTALGTGVRAAAIREVFEEAGVLLAYHDEQILAISDAEVAPYQRYREAFQQRQGSLIEMALAERLILATDQLHYFAHWITPAGMPKRFDTHFFIAIAPARQEAAYDRLETSAGAWINPAAALADYERGEFPLVFATIHQLRDLAAFSSVQEALAFTETHHVPVRMPILEQENGATRVYLPDDAEHTWNVPEHMTKSKERS